MTLNLRDKLKSLNSPKASEAPAPAPPTTAELVAARVNEELGPAPSAEDPVAFKFYMKRKYEVQKRVEKEIAAAKLAEGGGLAASPSGEQRVVASSASGDARPVVASSQTSSSGAGADEFLCTARVVQDYDPETTDEDGVHFITLRVGDVVYVTARDETGWWAGQCKLDAGVFPGSFVEVVGEGATTAAAPLEPAETVTVHSNDDSVSSSSAASRTRLDSAHQTYTPVVPTSVSGGSAPSPSGTIKKEKKQKKDKEKKEKSSAGDKVADGLSSARALLNARRGTNTSSPRSSAPSTPAPKRTGSTNMSDGTAELCRIQTTEIAKLQSELREVKKQMESLSSQNTTLTHTVAENYKELEKERLKSQQLAGELKAAQQSGANSGASSEQMQQLTEHNAALQSAVDELQAALEGVTADAELTAEGMAAAATELAAKQGEIDALRTQIDNMEAQVSALTSGAAGDSKTVDLATRLAASDKSLLAERAKVAEANAAIQKLKDELTASAVDAETLGAHVAELETQLSASRPLTGRVIAVTGGASGIGARLSARLAEAGAHVVVHYNSHKAEADALVATLAGAGLEAFAVGGDLTQEADVTALVSATVTKYGRLDTLICNAGSYKKAALLDMPLSLWDETHNLNVRSAFMLVQAAGRQFRAQGLAGGKGSIVLISSIEASTTAFEHAAYTSSKAALEMLARNAALELAPLGVRVNCVAPGLVWAADLEKQWADGVRRWKERCPAGELVQPDEVADAVIYLAGPTASGISGASLPVDHGVLTAPSF